MSLLSYNELCELVERGVICPVEHDQINASSIDVRLGSEIIVERRPTVNTPDYVSPKDRTNFTQTKVTISEDFPYFLEPSEFILASTQEVFNLPMDISAEFRLKSSGARSGLNNLFACHCDSGWSNSVLTLELHNVLRYHAIKLTPGMFIGQMLFHRHTPVPLDRSYAARGRYLNDASVSAVKP